MVTLTVNVNLKFNINSCRACQCQGLTNDYTGFDNNEHESTAV